MFLVNNIIHSLFKQISVGLNRTLSSPQTDTYHYKAYLETLVNYTRDDGDHSETTRVVQYGQCTGHRHTGQRQLSESGPCQIQRPDARSTSLCPSNQSIFCFGPHRKVFNLSKLLIPSVQIGIQMYFNPPVLWSMRYKGAKAFRLNAEDIKSNCICQVRLDPSVYRELMTEMNNRKNIVTNPMVRSEIRTFNITQNTLRCEISNPFQNRLPNMVVVGLAISMAFNGAIGEYPYTFQQFNLTSIKQVVRGETYPYKSLGLLGNNGSKDARGYRQFLQATGCLIKSQGNMVKAEDWGNGKGCTLFVFENAAIVFGEFEHFLEINSNKTVQYDMYQL